MFEKVKVWKAFVEYSTLESAFEAKRNLNDFVLFNDGTRLSVYFSNLETIKFQNNNSGGIGKCQKGFFVINFLDYTLQEETETTDSSQNLHSPPRMPSGLIPRNDLPRIMIFLFVYLWTIEHMMKSNGFPNDAIRQGKTEG